MARQKSVFGESLLKAALEGLEMQKQRIDGHLIQVRAMLGKRPRGRPRKATTDDKAVVPRQKVGKRRPLSAAARKRIGLAQKKRWAEYRKAKQAAA